MPVLDATTDTDDMPDIPDPFEVQRQTSRQLAKPTVEGYTIVAFIGEGTYGDVWKAVHKESGTIDAIKRLLKRPDAQARGEARMLAALSASRGIVRLKKSQLESEPYCYVMEYMQGGTLGELIERSGKLPFAKAWEMFRELVEGLRYVHREGAVHCDIKPDNILLDALGKPRLSDFGQARGHGPGGASLGTPFYMPPEQARLGLPDPRWDVYALGAVLYQMLTGTKPRHNHELSNELSLHSQSSTEVNTRLQKYAAHLDRVPGIGELKDVDPGVVDLLKRCLANDFEARPKDACEVYSLVSKLEQKRRRRSLLFFGGVGPAAALLVIGLLMIAGGTYAFNRFTKMWTDQVVDDNQAVASAIAQATNERFSEQMRIVEKEAERWRQIIAGRGTDEAAFQEAIRREIKTSYDEHSLKLDGWHLTDAEGKMLVNYGDIARQKNPKFEDTAINKQYGWRGWFNGHKDRKELSEDQRKNFPAASAKQALIDRPSDLFFSAPYKRRVDGIWVMTISRRLTPLDGGPPVGVLSGQFAFLTFVDFISHFESDVGYQPRKVVVANELSQAMYHSRLQNSVDPSAAAMEEEIDTDDAPEVSPQSKDYEFFVKTAFSEPHSGDTATRVDPWDVGSSEPYFIGRDVLKLNIKPPTADTATSGGDGQKLAVFVFHEEDRALQKLRTARAIALALGIGVLLIGGLFLAGNIWGLQRTLSREESVEYA